MPLSYTALSQFLVPMHRGKKLPLKQKNRAFSFLRDTGTKSCTCWSGGDAGPAQARWSQSHPRLPVEKECSPWVTPGSCCKQRSGPQEASHGQRRKGTKHNIWLTSHCTAMTAFQSGTATHCTCIYLYSLDIYLFLCPVFETVICSKWWQYLW